MQTEDIAVCLLQGRKDFLEVVQAVGCARRIIATTPITMMTVTVLVTIEPHTRRIHHTVEHHMVAVSIDQPLAFHMEGG